MSEIVKTGEFVSPSHPDRMCDVIVEALYQATREQYPEVLFSLDCMIKNNVMQLGGELSRRLGKNDEMNVILSTMRQLGYDQRYLRNFGLIDKFDHYRWVMIKEPSNINSDWYGYDERGLPCEGPVFPDTCTVVGVASNETIDYMPSAATWVAKYLLRNLYGEWEAQGLPVGPDMRAQVTMVYKNDIPERVGRVILNVAHFDSYDFNNLYPIVEDILGQIEESTGWSVKHTQISINPTGRFTFYGPVASAGLSGRKLNCDFYGTGELNGASAICGKDFYHASRSGAYAARLIAKTLVAEGFATRANVYISYATATGKPQSVRVDTAGTKWWKKRAMNDRIRSFSTDIEKIIEEMKLNEIPSHVYMDCAKWGSMGATISEEAMEKYDKPWERIATML